MSALVQMRPLARCPVADLPAVIGWLCAASLTDMIEPCVVTLLECTHGGNWPGSTGHIPTAQTAIQRAWISVSSPHLNG